MFKSLPFFQHLYKVLIVIFLSVIPLTGVATVPFHDFGRYSSEHKNESLQVVIQNLSLFFGKEIRVNDAWLKWPVTIQLQNVTLHQAINRILSKTNYSVTYSNDGRIQIKIEGLASDTFHKPHISAMDVEGLIEVVPGTSADEYRFIVAQQDIIDPKDIEVVPPEEPGGKGLTQREIDAIKTNQVPVDPMKIEIVPPDEPNARTTTYEEYQSIKNKMKEPSQSLIEDVPPEKNEED